MGKPASNKRHLREEVTAESIGLMAEKSTASFLDRRLFAGSTVRAIRDCWRDGEQVKGNRWWPDMREEDSRANRNVAWIESVCRIPEGKLVGQRVKLTGLPARMDKSDIRYQHIRPHRPQKRRRRFPRFSHVLCGPGSGRTRSLFSAAQSRDRRRSCLPWLQRSFGCRPTCRLW